MFYDKLTMEEVAKFYKLLNFLRRLRIIGHLEAHTEQVENVVYEMEAYTLVDMTDANYRVVKDSYSSSRERISAEDLLEKLYGRPADAVYRRS